MGDSEHRDDPTGGPTPPPMDWATPSEAGASPPLGAPPGAPPLPPRPTRAVRRAFDFGGVLGGTFKVYGRMLVSVLTLSVILLGPLAAAQMIALSDVFTDIYSPDTSRIDEAALGKMMMWFAGLALLQGILQMVLAGAISFLVVRHQQGHPVGVGEALRRGFARLLPITGTVVLLGLIVAGMFLPAVILGVATRSPVVAGLLVLAALVPMFLFLFSTYAAVPACAVEGLGPVASLRRSRQLCIGFRGQIFGLMFVMGIINYAIGMVAQAPFAVSQDFKLTFYAQSVLGVVATAPLSAILIALIYIELRAVKEGVDPAGIVSVFD